MINNFTLDEYEDYYVDRVKPCPYHNKMKNKEVTKRGKNGKI
jgi:hypothetical protein